MSINIDIINLDFMGWYLLDDGAPAEVANRKPTKDTVKPNHQLEIVGYWRRTTTGEEMGFPYNFKRQELKQTI